MTSAARQRWCRRMCRRVVVPAGPVLAWTRSQTRLTSHRPWPFSRSCGGSRCSRALVSSVEAEHALGYPGDLDLAPDRAPLREFVVAPQRRDARQPAGPARVWRGGGVEAALHQGEPGLAVRPVELPAGGGAVGEPPRRLAARFAPA